MIIETIHVLVLLLMSIIIFRGIDQHPLSLVQNTLPNKDHYHLIRYNYILYHLKVKYMPSILHDRKAPQLNTIPEK